MHEGTKYLLYCLSTGLQLEVHKNQEPEHDFKPNFQNQDPVPSKTELEYNFTHISGRIYR